MFPRVGEKRRIDDIGLDDEEAIGGLCRLSGRPVSPKTAMEQEKRIRREIANSNERRRMQSINAGFASLKTRLPHNEGEKLSKAAILQQTAEYIYQLEQEKTRLLSQNCQLKRLLNHQQHHADAEGSPAGGESPCDDGSSGGEMINTPVDGGAEELRREMIDLRMQLERERRHRMSLEDHIHTLEANNVDVPDRNKEVSSYTTLKPDKREPKVEVVTVPEIVPPAQVNKVEVTTNPRIPLPTTTTSITTTTSTTTIKSEPLSPSSDHQHHPSSPAHTAAVAPTTTTSAVAPQAASTTTTTTTVIGQPPLRHQAAPVLNRQSQNPSGHNNQVPASVVSTSPATTIVTVVPSAKGGVDALPSVFEALTSSGRFGAKVEVEPAPRVPSPETTIEYVDDAKNHTVYIVNSTNAACQKSLDTICEAIRHLEGDHMFQTEDQHPRIEEEIITDETLTIEDDIEEQHVTLAEEEPITLHMVGEPQEVPLELTTTHRPSTTQYPQLAPQQPATISLNMNSGGRLLAYPTTRVLQASKSVEAMPVCSISTTTSSSSTLLQPSRPGVIVVKHP